MISLLSFDVATVTQMINTVGDPMPMRTGIAGTSYYSASAVGTIQTDTVTRFNSVKNGSLKIEGAGANGLRLDFSGDLYGYTVGIGFALYRTTWASGTVFVAALGAMGYTHDDSVRLTINPYGNLTVEIVLGSVPRTVLTSPIKIVPNLWHRIELYFNNSNSTIGITLVVNGCSQTVTPAVNGYQFTIARVTFGTLAANTGNPLWYDDVVIADDGVVRGDCKVETLTASGDSQVSFTPTGTGITNNYQPARQVPPDTGKYNASSKNLPINSYDLLTFDDLPAAAKTISAVQWELNVRSDNSADGRMNFCTNTSGNFYTTASSMSDLTCWNYYTLYIFASTTVPSSGADWTPTAVNQGTFGYIQTR